MSGQGASSVVRPKPLDIWALRGRGVVVPRETALSSCQLVHDVVLLNALGYGLTKEEVFASVAYAGSPYDLVQLRRFGYDVSDEELYASVNWSCDVLMLRRCGISVPPPVITRTALFSWCAAKHLILNGVSVSYEIVEEAGLWCSDRDWFCADLTRRVLAAVEKKWIETGLVCLLARTPVNPELVGVIRDIAMRNSVYNGGTRASYIDEMQADYSSFQPKLA